MNTQITRRQFIVTIIYTLMFMWLWPNKVSAAPPATPPATTTESMRWNRRVKRAMAINDKSHNARLHWHITEQTQRYEARFGVKFYG